MPIHELKEQIARLPEQPGVYLYFNADGDTIYVGKARALRDRVRNYLGAYGGDPKTDALLNEHYAHIASKPFFPEVRSFMQQTPVIALALAGDNVVARVRDLLGPTDSKKAAKGTIRGDFGVDVMVNVCHASDSTEAAAAELKRFFQPDELF